MTSSRPRAAAPWRVRVASADASAAATRGSASSSAAAAALPLSCAKSSEVLPSCSRGAGRVACRRAPLCAPHRILCQGVHPRGRKKEGDNGGAAFESSRMQRGVASVLQGREEIKKTHWEKSRWGI